MRIARENLGRFASFRLKAPGPASALQQGDRRSPFLGRGMEFADYRPYDPGDDLRLVDWNVYFRLQHALVRQFNEERSLSVRICVDVSGSMAFGSPSKADHAAALAAALCVIGLSHRDPVSVCCFGSTQPPVQARAVNLDGMAEILHLLGRVEPGGRGGTYAQLAASLGGSRCDRLVLISDLLGEDAEREAVLRLLAAGCRSPVVLHVLAPEEIAPDLDDLAGVVDDETHEELVLASDGHALERYRQALDHWLHATASRCRALGIQYLRADTTASIEDVVLGALQRARIVEHAAGGTA